MPPRIACPGRTELPGLAARLAALPLLQRYGSDAAQLVAGLRRALTTPGSGLLVAYRTATARQPLGLCWYLRRGTFGDGAYLRLLAVWPGAQRHGTGSLLLQTFERRCRGAPAWFLLCAGFNAAAQRFYRTQGYQAVGALGGYVRPDIVEIIYCKRPGAAASPARRRSVAAQARR